MCAKKNRARHVFIFNFIPQFYNTNNFVKHFFGGAKSQFQSAQINQNIFPSMRYTMDNNDLILKRKKKQLKNYSLRVNLFFLLMPLHASTAYGIPVITIKNCEIV
jgi:hypothetical protein